MNEYTIYLDELLKTAILSHVIIKIDGNNYKEGTLISFGYNFFNLNVNIKNKKKIKNDLLKIPLPFEANQKHNIITFDYRIKTFTKNNKDMENLINSLKKTCVSKFYDKVLTIEVIT